MPFSEAIKLVVKEKAAFRCCRCQQIGIDVHHIMPEKHGGSNNIDNAAPLCQNCHDQFGDNPSKRKETCQMRDWWYERSKKYFQPQDFGILNDINSKLESIQHGQENMSELKDLLKSVSNQTIEKISLGTAASVSSAIVNSADAVQLGPKVYSNFFCPNCNTRIGLLIGSDVCPKCKAPIKR